MGVPKTGELGTASNTIMPKSLPYLRNSWDRLDEYHSMDSNVTEEDFINWFSVIFNKLKIHTWKDCLNIQPYQVLGIAHKNPVNFYGNFETDLIGGMFGICGMYTQGFHLDFLPKETFHYSKNLQARFDWIYGKCRERYPQNFKNAQT